MERYVYRSFNGNLYGLQKKIKDLVDSIYNEYPIGLITLYVLPQEMRRESGALYWVIDGQQRLLSLTLLLDGYVSLANGQKKELWIWFDPSKEELTLRVTKPPRRLHYPWVKLSDFLKMKRDQLEEFIRDRPVKEKIRIERIWSRFRDYRITYHEIRGELDYEMLGDIFVRTNFAGTRVKGSDVYSTIIAITHPGLVKELRAFSKSLKIKFGWEIDYGILIRTFIALAADRVKFASRVFEQATKLKDVFRTLDLNKVLKRLKNSIEMSIRLLMDTFRLTEPLREFLPSENVLVTMAYYLDRKGKLSNSEQIGLLKWFVLASSFRRYSSAPETRLNEDISTIRDGGNYKELILNIEKREGNLKERIKSDISEWGKMNKLLLYTILWIKNAKDWRPPYNEIYAKDVTLHHIFPRSRLIDSEWEDLLDDIGNLTLINARTNIVLRDKLPQEYLSTIPESIRRTHLIPNEPELWKIENFARFLEERKRLLMQAVDDLF